MERRRIAAWETVGTVRAVTTLSVHRELGEKVEANKNCKLFHLQLLLSPFLAV